MPNLGSTTRMALRAAVATGLAIALTAATHLTRPYWLILVAVVVVNQTWGSSVVRSLQRSGMTVLGCLLGWFLHWISSGIEPAQVIMMLVSVFLAVYFRQSWGRGSYPWMIFFISMYVVFLFAALGEWSPQIFLARMLDTLLGCGVAIVATGLIPPQTATRQLNDELERFWDRCRTDLVDANRRLSDTNGRMRTGVHADLLQQLESIRSHAQDAHYETLLKWKTRRRAGALIGRARLVCFYVLAFIDAANESPRTAAAELVYAILRPVFDAGATDVFGTGDEPPVTIPVVLDPDACARVVQIAKSEDSHLALVYYALRIRACLLGNSEQLDRALAGVQRPVEK